MDEYSKLLQLRQAQISAQKLEKLARPKTSLDVYSELALKDPELAAIAMIESSGGKNTAHTLDPKSGMTAGGMFGMMPGSASDIVRLDKSISAKYPEIVELVKDLPANHPKITEFFNNNPEAAAEFARSKYQRNKNRLGGDLDQTAYSWLNGLQGTLNKRREDPSVITNHDYVKKFNEFRNPKAKVTKN